MALPTAGSLTGLRLPLLDYLGWEISRIGQSALEQIIRPAEMIRSFSVTVRFQETSANAHANAEERYTSGAKQGGLIVGNDAHRDRL